MEVRIKRLDNGFLIEGCGRDNASYVFEIDDNTEECEAFRDLVYTLSDSLGLFGNRHAAKRFYGIIAPGDNHKDFQDYHSDAIWGKDEA